MDEGEKRRREANAKLEAERRARQAGRSGGHHMPGSLWEQHVHNEEKRRRDNSRRQASDHSVSTGYIPRRQSRGRNGFEKFLSGVLGFCCFLVGIAAIFGGTGMGLATIFSSAGNGGDMLVVGGIVIAWIFGGCLVGFWLIQKGQDLM